MSHIRICLYLFSFRNKFHITEANGICKVCKVFVRNLCAKIGPAPCFRIDLIFLKSRVPDCCTTPNWRGVETEPHHSQLLLFVPEELWPFGVDTLICLLKTLSVPSVGKDREEKGIDLLWQMGEKKAKKSHKQRAKTRELRCCHQGE